MSLAIRYIFGCKHQDRDVSGKTVFERGLELPAAYCKECVSVCNICLEITTVRAHNSLDLCDSCITRVKNLQNKA